MTTSVSAFANVSFGLETVPVRKERTVDSLLDVSEYVIEGVPCFTLSVKRRPAKSSEKPKLVAKTPMLPKSNPAASLLRKAAVVIGQASTWDNSQSQGVLMAFDPAQISKFRKELESSELGRACIAIVQRIRDGGDLPATDGSEGPWLKELPESTRTSGSSDVSDDARPTRSSRASAVNDEPMW